MNICRSKNGFIKLHYKIQESDLWNDNNALLAFLRMIGLAHYEDNFTSIRFRGQQRKLRRGEFSATMSELANSLHLPLGTARKVIQRLENDGRIGTRSDNRITIFSICNYDKYQDTPDNQKDKQPGKQQDNRPDKRNRGLKDIKEYKEDKDIYVNDCSLTGNSSDLFFELVTLLGFDKTRVKYLTDRQRKLKLRLRQFSPDELRQAAKNLANSPYHQGDNDSGRRYGDIDFLLRTDAQVEKWRDMNIKQTTYKAEW